MTSANYRKVAIVGAGAVGSTFAYALAQSGLADEIVLIDQNKELARGQVLDLAHRQPFFPAVSMRFLQYVFTSSGVAVHNRSRGTFPATHDTLPTVSFARLISV